MKIYLVFNKPVELDARYFMGKLNSIESNITSEICRIRLCKRIDTVGFIQHEEVAAKTDPSKSLLP
jgi:hypothetical protein